MTDENTPLPPIGQQIAEADARLAISNTQLTMPLDITIRSIALTVAQRHCGDTTVKEGNLYQQLKMDNKLAGPLTVEHVIYAAAIFERFLWGEWSKGIAADAMASALDEVDKELREQFKDEPPIRPHSGGETP